MSEADRAALAEVLAGPEFHPRRLDLAALRALLEAWWGRLLELLGTAEAERWASLGRAVFLAALAVALLLGWRALRRRGRSSRPRTAGPAADLVLAAIEAEPTAVDAIRALAVGDRAGAVRLAFRASAARLWRRGEPAGTANLTGRELAERLPDPGFGALARLHERTVFGLRPVSADEARGAVEVAARLARGEATP